MVREVTILILGFAMGVAWYKSLIVNLTRKHTHTMCTYCEYLVKLEEMFPKKKK